MDCRDVGRDGFSEAKCSLAVICNEWGIGRADESRTALDCGGGVGNAFGGMAGEPSVSAGFVGKLGENGGVGAGGRGVEPLEPGLDGPCTGVLRFDISPDRGVSVLP